MSWIVLTVRRKDQTFMGGVRLHNDHYPDEKADKDFSAARNLEWEFRHESPTLVIMKSKVYGGPMWIYIRKGEST